MCLAVPLKVTYVGDLVATVDVFGATREVSLLLLPEKAKPGDYVLVHAGFAIQRLDEEAAIDTLSLLREMAEALEQEETRHR